jgi:ATP-dependent helicase HrpB
MYDVPGSRLRILEGSVPLRVELLAPSRRPIQVTTDLDKFWQTSYEGVKKELKGRYPKHEWR